jgi:hypothetical protein
MLLFMPLVPTRKLSKCLLALQIDELPIIINHMNQQGPHPHLASLKLVFLDDWDDEVERKQVKQRLAELVDMLCICLAKNVTALNSLMIAIDGTERQWDDLYDEAILIKLSSLPSTIRLLRIVII